MTTIVAATAAAAATGSLPVAAGVAAGGFLIDLDHLADYLVFERQWDLRPGAFLHFYLEGIVLDITDRKRAELGVGRVPA